jgi:hypothetical protein
MGLSILSFRLYPVRSLGILFTNRSFLRGSGAAAVGCVDFALNCVSFTVMNYRMKGMVFTEFLEMVEEKFGYEVLDRLTALPCLSENAAYTAVGNYPHGDILRMLDELHDAVGLPHKELILAFAGWMFDVFLRLHPEFFDRIQSTFDFLNGIDTVIHTEVRRLYSDARTPSFEASALSADQMVLEYSSWRPFADLAEGLILAASAHFKEDIAIEREEGATGDGRSARFVLTRSSAES